MITIEMIRLARKFVANVNNELFEGLYSDNEDEVIPGLVYDLSGIKGLPYCTAFALAIVACEMKVQYLMVFSNQQSMSADIDVVEHALLDCINNECGFTS